GGGVSTVNLTSLGINSQTDGVLLVNQGANAIKYALSKANTDGTWTLYVHDPAVDGAVYTQNPVDFVFIPKTNVSVVSGKFQGDGTILMYSGSTPAWSVTNIDTGEWELVVPGYSPTNGVLIVSPEGGNGANADNIVSCQPNANGLDWIIQSRDL